MHKSAAMAFAACLLAACGDPLADVPRLAEVELAPDDPVVQAALPTEAEVAREGFFGTDAATAPTTIAPAADVAAVPATPQRRGLWGLLRPSPVAVAPVLTNAGQVEAAGAEVTGAAVTGVEVTGAENVAPSTSGDPVQPASAVTTASTAPAAPSSAPRRRGLLGLFGSNVLELEPELPSESRLNGAIPTPPSSPDPEGEPPVELAALVPEPTPDRPRRGGFFSRLAQPSSSAAAAPDMPEVEYGTVLPFGVIARSCGAKRQSLGRKVESADASGYKLYDSNPRTTAQRTFYITGFDDGCPRQLTAAHVLLGAPAFYELLHYGPAGQHLKFGETDRAYEQVKGRVCGVRKGKPCGSKMKTLERSTFFVNSYPRGDDNRSWSEMLIHKGRVMAKATKSSG